MNIQEATLRAMQENLWIRKRDREEAWCLYVAAGSIYRNQDGAQVDLDARDCIADDWYLINDNGDEVS